VPAVARALELLARALDELGQPPAHVQRHVREHVAQVHLETLAGVLGGMKKKVA